MVTWNSDLNFNQDYDANDLLNFKFEDYTADRLADVQIDADLSHFKEFTMVEKGGPPLNDL